MKYPFVCPSVCTTETFRANFRLLFKINVAIFFRRFLWSMSVYNYHIRLSVYYSFVTYGRTRFLLSLIQTLNPQLHTWLCWATSSLSRWPDFHQAPDTLSLCVKFQHGTGKGQIYSNSTRDTETGNEQWINLPVRKNPL